MTDRTVGYFAQTLLQELKRQGHSVERVGELMADLRCRAADRREPFTFEKLSLQPGFFRNITNECSVMNLLIDCDLRDGQLYGKGLAVFPLRGNRSNSTDSVGFAGAFHSERYTHRAP